MVNVYIKTDVEYELLKIADERNDKLRAVKKEATVKDSTIIQEIVYDWYEKCMAEKRGNKE